MLRSLHQSSKTLLRYKNNNSNVISRIVRRTLSTEEPIVRDQMHYDVITVGAGPAGLAAAIRLKQLSIEKGVDLSVCVVEKGAEVGAHILSGNVFEPRALDELIPNWREMEDCPIKTKAKHDDFYWLFENGSKLSVPQALIPKQLHNEGNYVVSLSQMTKWLAAQAEALGVEIYAGFSADGIVYDSDNKVRGIFTKDVGIAKDNTRKDTFTPGVELLGRQVILAEGCRGSCSESVMKKFNLREGKDEQTYGLGIKEVWQVPEKGFQAGFIQHTLGFPLQKSFTSDVFGGSFLYHMEPNYVLVGMVVGLDYKNPYLNPYKEFQQFKHHPEIAKHLEGGECVSYGARVLNEGGYHAIPKLTFPGGVLVGCSAGFLNSVKIKGTHTAMKSGMLAAENIYDLLAAQSASEGSTGTVASGNLDYFQPSSSPNTAVLEVSSYETAVYSSWIAKELFEIRNTHASFSSPLGMLAGMAYTALSCFITKGREPWTIKNTVKDSDKTLPASQCKEIQYPKPDNKLSFDLLTNLARANTNHEHDQPSHLRVKEEHAEANTPTNLSLAEYAGPEQRFCPAGVYEYSEADATTGERKLIINAQNCVHCKCCSIKMPKEYINWTVPEGGGGPNYTLM